MKRHDKIFCDPVSYASRTTSRASHVQSAKHVGAGISERHVVLSIRWKLYTAQPLYFGFCVPPTRSASNQIHMYHRSSASLSVNNTEPNQKFVFLQHEFMVTQEWFIQYIQPWLAQLEAKQRPVEIDSITKCESEALQLLKNSHDQRSPENGTKIPYPYISDLGGWTKHSSIFICHF